VGDSFHSPCLRVLRSQRGIRTIYRNSAARNHRGTRRHPYPTCRHDCRDQRPDGCRRGCRADRPGCGAASVEAASGTTSDRPSRVRRDAVPFDQSSRTDAHEHSRGPARLRHIRAKGERNRGRAAGPVRPDAGRGAGIRGQICCGGRLGRSASVSCLPTPCGESLANRSGKPGRSECPSSVRCRH